MLEPLSSGGNAQVFLARDTVLQRQVALKVLTGASAWDPERLLRLQREARILAQLNHPNILQVVDLVRWEEQPVLVTEFLSGRTLRSVIAEGALPPWKAVDLALQVAEALEAAHAKGIVHRDIKPENLILTQEGRCKVLDFGLAKPLREDDQTVLGESLHTSTGLLQGTVGYLSPEQIGGQPVDGRSDIYALGLVLWELITGRPPGQGATPLERQIHLLKEGPGSLGSLRGASAALEGVLHQCLAVDARDRFPDAASLGRALRDLGTSPQGLRLPPPRWLGRAALAVLAGASAVGAWGLLRRERPLPVFRRLTFQRGNVLHARFGPGGQSVVLGAAWDGHPTELFRVDLPEGDTKRLGISGADVLAVGRSGELAILLKHHYLYSTLGAGTLARWMPGKGAPRLLMDEVTGADWDPQGQDLAVTRHLGNGAWVLEYPLGRVLYQSATPLGGPRFSPDGEQIAFMGTSPEFTIFLRRKDGSVATLLEHVQASDPILGWAPDSRALLFAGNTRSDWMPPVLRLDTQGGVKPLARFPMRTLLHDVAPDGRLLIERELLRLDMQWREGRNGPPRPLSWLDGSQVAAVDARRRRVLFTELFEAVGQRPQVFLREVDGGKAVRLGFGRGEDLSPDGSLALAIDSETRPLLRLLPLREGVPRDIPLPGRVPIEARFRPGHGEVLLVARDLQQATRLLLVDLASGALRQVVDRDILSALPSQDGKVAAVRLGSGQLALVDLDTGALRELGMPPLGMEAQAWSDDNRTLFLTEVADRTLRIYRQPVSGGPRRLDRVVALPDDPEVVRVDRVRLSPGGQVLVHFVLRITQSDLLTAQGIE